MGVIRMINLDLTFYYFENRGFRRRQYKHYQSAAETNNNVDIHRRQHDSTY